MWNHSRSRPAGSVVLHPFAQQLSKLEWPAEQLSWLQLQRLLGVVPLLVERGLVTETTWKIAKPLADKYGRVSLEQLLEERRVLAGMNDSGVRCLCLKGVGLGWGVYPNADQRLRGDLDLLVPPNELPAARKCLAGIGYQPARRTRGGVPSCQESWVRRKDGLCWMIDLHWKLRNHPALRDRLSFEEQWADSIAMPKLHEGARRQSSVHAMLNASMHWFDVLFPSEHPLIWLLDKDLLWRSMSQDARTSLVSLAGERQLSGLLSESLRMSQFVFETPVPDRLITDLEAVGRDQRPTGLIRAGRNSVSAFFFSLQCEPDLNARLRRFGASLFPTSEHLMERFPEGSSLGLAGLHLRRWLRWIRSRE